MYSVLALPNEGIVTAGIEYHVPVPPDVIRSESVKLMLGTKVTGVAELLYHVALIFSPD